MRKVFFILMIAISFYLGTASPWLFAGNWVYPKYGTSAPTLSGYFCLEDNPGVIFYKIPDKYKLISYGKTSLNNVWVKLQKME